MSGVELRSLPLVNGFRQRGTETTRLEAFTDAAFAFAVTLLVVGGADSIPRDFDAMIGAMKQIPAFAASFANIMLFWYAHHIWSRRFGLEDSRAVLISLLLIFVVLIYVYPLRAIYSGAIDFFTGGYLDSYFTIGSAGDLRSMYTIFGIGYAALSGIIVMLNRYARSQRDSLSLNDLEVFDTQTAEQHWWLNVAVPLVSILLAAVLPATLLAVPGIFYGVLGVLIPWHAIRREKRRGSLI